MSSISGRGFFKCGAVIIDKVGTYEEVVGTEVLKLGPGTMQKFAALIPVSEYSDKYLYVRARAVSGFEKYGPNENGDAFEWDQLFVAYPTFVRGGVYKDHNNGDRKQAIGIIVDAWPNNDEEFVEVLMAVNRAKAPNEVGLIESGKLTDVSMGCVVDEAICSICGNIARDESQYCSHIRESMKGQHIDGRPCFEYNRGVRFFEVSLISPWSEAADPQAKIKETVAAKQSRVVSAGFEEWIADPAEPDVSVPNSDRRERVSMKFVFGQLVITKDGKRGVVVGGSNSEVSVRLEGDDGPHLFQADYLTPIAQEPTSEEVVAMARQSREDVKPRTAQGEGPEDYDMEHPFRGNPTRGRWRGDYGSSAEKYQQDFDRTNVDSDPTDLRGQQMSSERERGDYLHKGYTGDKAEGKAPIGVGAGRNLPKTAAELEEVMDDTLEQVAEIGIELEDVKEKEAKKKGVLGRIKGAMGFGKEADYTEYDEQSPNKGTPMRMRDPSDDQYNPASTYFAAQKSEADTKDNETRTDIEKQKPYNYSNTPEEISKLRSVAASEDVGKLADILKKVFKEDEKKIGEFIDTVKKLEDADFEELAQALKGVKEEEDAEVDKAKDKDEGDKEDKPTGPSKPLTGPPKPPTGPPKPLTGPPKPPTGPPGPVGPPKLPGAPGPGATMMGDVRMYARQAAAAKALSKLAAVGQWGNEDPVAHAKRMVLQQISRDPSTDPTSMFWMAADIRGLDEAEMSRLAAELHIEVPGLSSKTASKVDYSMLTDAEVLGAYKVLQATTTPPDVMNAVLTAMIERGIRPKVAAEKKDVLRFIYDRMSRDKMPFAEARREAEAKFHIITKDPGKPDTRPLGFGHETEGPGSSSELGSEEPSDGRYLGSGTSLPSGVTSRAYDERTPYRSSSMRRKAADGKFLNDYDITFGTNTRWDERTKSMSEQETATQKKDFATELREARKKELATRTGKKVPDKKSQVQTTLAAYKAGEISDEDMLEVLTNLGTGEAEETTKTAAGVDTYTGPETIKSDERGAPSVSLADEENSKQKKDFATELKEATGLKIGERIKVVVGASEEGHLAEIADISETGIIHVDYQDGIRNRDAIDLKEGRSKVFGTVRVYTRPEILTVKKGNWIGYGNGKMWSIYNFRREGGKLAEVALSEVDPKTLVADFQLEGEDQVPEFFASPEYGKAVLDKMQEFEEQGGFEDQGTGLSATEGSPDEVTIGAKVVIAEDWMPSGEESEELVHDIVQLRDEEVPGIVSAVDEVSDEVQVDFGGDRAIILSSGEIKVAKDINESGTDTKWTGISKSKADQENKTQQAEFAKEQVLSAFGPDSQRNTHLASRTASKVGQFEEHIAFMSSLVRDAGLSAKEALPHIITAFEMDESDTEAFVSSDEYTEAFETPPTTDNADQVPELGVGKEVTQLRVTLSGMKKRLCARIAAEMYEKGMIKGITADMPDDDVGKAIDSQIDRLMKLDDTGLYEFETAVKSATDPDGIEALKKRSTGVGPREGALHQPLIMRGASSKIANNTLDDPNFFK